MKMACGADDYCTLNASLFRSLRSIFLFYLTCWPSLLVALLRFITVVMEEYDFTLGHLGALHLERPLNLVFPVAYSRPPHRSPDTTDATG